MIWLYIGIVVLLFVIYFVVQNTIKGKLMIAYQREDYNTYYALLDSTLAKICIPAYNREYMRLNGYIEEKCTKKVNKQLELLFKARKNKAQTEDLIQKSLQFYVNEKNSKNCHKLLNYMQNEGIDPKILKEASYVIDILVDHKTNHVQELEQKLNDAEETQKIVYYYLLQVQYENLNNMKMAKYYENLLNETQK